MLHLCNGTIANCSLNDVHPHQLPPIDPKNAHSQSNISLHPSGNMVEGRSEWKETAVVTVNS